MDIHGVTPGTVWEITKAAGEIGNKLYEFGKSLANKDERHQVELILDQLRDLKQSASLLEDENRDLREKLRFTRENYNWEAPFWYLKDDAAKQALCPKCFASKVEGPMSAPYQSGTASYQKCLVCGHLEQSKSIWPTQTMFSDSTGEF